MNTEWEKIAENTINAAELIDCPFHEFVAGLQLINDSIYARLSCAEDELRTQDVEEVVND